MCVYLHPWRRGVPAHQHADLLLIGQQSSDRFLVGGVSQVDAVDLQDTISNAQAALTRQAMWNHLTRTEHTRRERERRDRVQEKGEGDEGRD